MYTNTFKAIDINREAENIGINMLQFKECVNHNSTKKRLIADTNHAVFLEVKGTPTIFINGIKIEGVHTYDVYSAFIENELKTVSAKNVK